MAKPQYHGCPQESAWGYPALYTTSRGGSKCKACGAWVKAAGGSGALISVNDPDDLGKKGYIDGDTAESFSPSLPRSTMKYALTRGMTEGEVAKWCYSSSRWPEYLYFKIIDCLPPGDPALGLDAAAAHGRWTGNPTKGAKKWHTVKFRNTVGGCLWTPYPHTYRGGGPIILVEGIFDAIALQRLFPESTPVAILGPIPYNKTVRTIETLFDLPVMDCYVSPDLDNPLDWAMALGPPWREFPVTPTDFTKGSRRVAHNGGDYASFKDWGSVLPYV